MADEPKAPGPDEGATESDFGPLSRAEEETTSSMPRVESVVPQRLVVPVPNHFELDVEGKRKSQSEIIFQLNQSGAWSALDDDALAGGPVEETRQNYQVARSVAEMLFVHSRLRVLPPDALKAIFLEVRPRWVARGEVVFRQGDDAGSMFMLRTGALSVERRALDGTETAGELPVGALFGAGSALHGTPREETVTAIDDSDLIEFNRELVQAVYQSQPAFVELMDSLVIGTAEAPALERPGRSFKWLMAALLLVLIGVGLMIVVRAA